MTTTLPTATWETITPDAAQRYLDKMGAQRPLKRQRVRMYADDMRAGRWQANGEPLHFDTDGRCINGQHRLQAVVTAQTAVPFLVVRNVNGNGLAVYDSGAARSGGDMLTYHGHVNTTTLSAAATNWFLYERDRLPRTGHTAPSRMEILRTVETHDALVRGTGIACGRPMARDIVGAGLLAFTLSYLTAYQPDLVTPVLHALEVGDEEADHPIVRLRNMLVTRRELKGRTYIDDRLAITIKAINALATGERPRQLAWRQRGRTAEAYPRFVFGPQIAPSTAEDAA